MRRQLLGRLRACCNGHHTSPGGYYCNMSMKYYSFSYQEVYHKGEYGLLVSRPLTETCSGERKPIHKFWQSICCFWPAVKPRTNYTRNKYCTVQYIHTQLSCSIASIFPSYINSGRDASMAPSKTSRTSDHQTANQLKRGIYYKSRRWGAAPCSIRSPDDLFQVGLCAIRWDKSWAPTRKGRL